MAARFFMPPERSFGIFSAASRRPTRSSCMSASVRRASAGRRVNSSRGSITFSRTLIDPKSAPDWYITPIFRRIRGRFAGFISSPATTIFPPSAGLDPLTSNALDDLVLRLRDASGVTFVVVTHELPSIFKIADRCAMFDRARQAMVALGRPADLRDGSSDPFVRQFFNRGGTHGS